MNIENDIPSYMRNDAKRVIDGLRARGVKVMGVRLPTSELPDLYFRCFHGNLRPTLFGFPVFFGVEGTIDIMTVGSGGLNRTFNNAKKETDFWLPPGWQSDEERAKEEKDK